ncbi:MAG TPA: hypothetical protein PK760_02535 [Flavobacteriales bacterium]|nr:hypothetical protein [Flavobacteriales bacterium]
MKTLIASLASIAALACTAQSDTSGAYMQSLELNVNRTEGLNVKMTDGDTVVQKGHFTIDTKYKRITVTTEPKHWASTHDSIEVVLHDRKVTRRNMYAYWAGIDLGVNTLLGEDGTTDLPKNAEFIQPNNAKSRFVSINFMEEKIEFGSHHVGLLTGLGLEFVNYRLSSNTLLQYNRDSIYGVPVSDPDLTKNKLRQMGLRMPLMLEFNTKSAPLPTEADVLAMRNDTTGTIEKKFKHSRKNNFHIAAGVVGSWYFDTMYKQKYELDGHAKKDRDKGDYLLLPYRAAAAVRVGYGGLNLFAEYSLTSLFQDGKGPQVTPFTVGLTIIGFN